MEETNDNVMDVDSGGSSDNTNMEMPIQSTEQSEKIQLAEMPREILERILIYLDYKNLLTASHVSKLFASIAETAFERKNKNEHYKIIQHQENKADVVMLNKYGEKMQKVTIIRCEEKWLDLVQEKCRNLKGLSLIGVPKIIMLKNLKEVSLDGIQNLDRDTFLEFIDNNPDIESLALKYIDVDLLSILDNRLHMLKMFTFCTENNIDSLDDLPTIRLNSLKTLDLELMESEAKSCKQLFRAIKCDKLENLYVDTFKLYYEDESDDAINGICKFETLVSLSLWYPIKSNQILTLAAHFPDLITFEVVIAEGESNFENLVHSILSMLPKLETLRIMLDENNNDRLLIELKSSTNDFHARFAKSNIKIGLDSEKFYVYGITKDYLSFFCDGSFEIHWMQNLNENRVRSMMTQYHFQPRVKFVNNCADRDFDISTLGKVHKGFVSMEYLDFKSNGPISVDSNASLYHILFPRLKILKIHLVQHAVIDFLRNLDATFCAQIEELWLDTKDGPEDPDIINILAKFKNLKFLQLVPSSVECSQRRLFSVCKNLQKVVWCQDSEQ